MATGSRSSGGAISGGTTAAWQVVAIRLRREGARNRSRRAALPHPPRPDDPVQAVGVGWHHSECCGLFRRRWWLSDRAAAQGNGSSRGAPPPVRCACPASATGGEHADHRHEHHHREHQEERICQHRPSTVTETSLDHPDDRDDHDRAARRLTGTRRGPGATPPAVRSVTSPPASRWWLDACHPGRTRASTRPIDPLDLLLLTALPERRSAL